MTLICDMKTNKTKNGQAAKSGNGRIRWKHFALFYHLQKHRQMSEIPKTNVDTNVQYSENNHKEDSQPRTFTQYIQNVKKHHKIQLSSIWQQLQNQHQR